MGILVSFAEATVREVRRCGDGLCAQLRETCRLSPALCCEFRLLDEAGLDNDDFAFLRYIDIGDMIFAALAEARRADAGSIAALLATLFAPREMAVGEDQGSADALRAGRAGDASPSGLL